LDAKINQDHYKIFTKVFIFIHEEIHYKIKT